MSTLYDDRTANLDLPLPHVQNTQTTDVGRLRDALTAVDSSLASKADLVSGKVPAHQLPGYVDDVLEYASLESFPATGEAGKLYISMDNGKVYRWSGSVYAPINDFVLAPATTVALGGVKVGAGLGIDPDGILYVVGGGGGSGLPVYGDQSIVPATNGQTVFTVSGGYNPGQLDVWLNGVMLVGDGDDFTASNGATFTLTAGINTTDLLRVRKWIYLPASQAVNKTGDTMTGALNWAPAVSVASAATTQIGLAASNLVTITGTTTITSFGSAAAGVVRTVTFAGALTLTHNAAGIVLPGGVNITTAGNDSAVFQSFGGGVWLCLSYKQHLAMPVLLSGNQTVTGSKRFSSAIAARLDTGAEGGAFAFERASDGVTHYTWQASGAGTTPGLRVVNHARGVQTFTIDHSGNVVAEGNVTGYSDERLKTNWAGISLDFIERLSRVKHGTYDRIDNGQRQVGVSAQALREVMPEAVLEDDCGTLSVAYGNAALVACVQLAQRILVLEERIRALEAR